MPCTRTKDEAAEMAGNLLIPECLDFSTSSRATPRHNCKHPVKVPESQWLFFASNWIIFGLDADLALHTNLGRMSQNGRKYIDPRMPRFSCTLGLITPRHKRKQPIKVSESRWLYIAMNWIILETGADLALHANLGRISWPEIY